MLLELTARGADGDSQPSRPDTRERACIESRRSGRDGAAAKFLAMHHPRFPRFQVRRNLDPLRKDESRQQRAERCKRESAHTKLQVVRSVTENGEPRVFGLLHL